MVHSVRSRIQILFVLGLVLLKNVEVDTKECRDRSRSCYHWYLMDYCNSPAFANAMFDTCEKTCGHCSVTNTKVNRRKRPTFISGCQDRFAACSTYKRYGYCQSYPDYMRQHCKKSCGRCVVAPTTQPPPITCKDDNANCQGWKVHCVKGGTYWTFMSKNCKKTCKICTDGSGGGGGGGSNGGKKQFTCGFEKGFCGWANQPIDDAVDWAVGTVAGGPSSGANSSASYAYVDTANSGYIARLILPWELVLPLGTSYIGSMCLNFRYQTGTGSLKFIEVIYPTLNNKSPAPQSRGTFQGSGTWVYGKVQVNVDTKRQLTIEGKTGSSGKVVIDNIAFVKGRC